MAGICAVATLEQIAEQGWSLNPGRYVEHTGTQVDDESFTDQILELKSRFTSLSQEASLLAKRVEAVMGKFG